MLQDLLGAQLDLPVRVAIATIVIAALLGLTVLIVRRLSGAGAGGGPRSRQARLAVVDSVAVDPRRRLVLVRRDEVEHLLLVGGTSDIVVEPAIGRTAAREAGPGARSLAQREAPALRDAAPARGIACFAGACGTRDVARRARPPRLCPPPRLSRRRNLQLPFPLLRRPISRSPRRPPMPSRCPRASVPP